MSEEQAAEVPAPTGYEVGSLQHSLQVGNAYTINTLTEMCARLEALQKRIVDQAFIISQQDDRIAKLEGIFDDGDGEPPSRSDIREMIKDILRDNCEIEIDASLRVSSW